MSKNSMRVLVTGSSGHLGEALVRTLQAGHQDVIGLDIIPSPFTTHVGTINDQALVSECMKRVTTVYHTATLHKPHVVTHSKQAFVETNISGTLTLLEEAVKAKVSAFIYTSTTSTFGDALRPQTGTPTAWITEAVAPIPRNIYGVSKLAAEDLCHLFYRQWGLACIILRTSRFFLEADDDKARREAFEDDNLKANEFLHRRVDLEDVVQAHWLAYQKADTIGFGRYIISATPPFSKEDQTHLRHNLPHQLERLYPHYSDIYQSLGWTMFEGIDRIYDNAAARRDLGWQPKYVFSYILDCLEAGRPIRSELATVVGSKGYHSKEFSEGPYPV